MQKALWEGRYYRTVGIMSKVRGRGGRVRDRENLVEVEKGGWKDDEGEGGRRQIKRERI